MSSFYFLELLLRFKRIYNEQTFIVSLNPGNKLLWKVYVEAF